jgi:hypothetical protein
VNLVTTRTCKVSKAQVAGRVEPMESESTRKCLLGDEHFEIRRRGRPRKGWLSDGEGDFGRIRSDTWTQRAQERTPWRQTEKEAKPAKGCRGEE